MAEELHRSVDASNRGRFELRIASQAQYHAILQQTADAWRYRLSADAYVQRELMVGRSRHAEGMTSWVLVPADKPDGLDVHSYCETWSAPVLYCPPGGKKTLVRPAIGIFTLFVPLHYRSCGFANLMAMLLYERLAREDLRWTRESLPELSPLLLFGFSDIGHDFYADWAHQVSPLEIAWPAGKSLGPEADRLPSQPIRYTDFERIAAADQRLIKTELISHGSTTAYRFCLLPRACTYAVHADVSRYMWSRLGSDAGPVSAAPEVFGCELGQPGDKDWAFAIWSTTWDYGQLRLLRLRATTRSQLVTLVTAAQVKARRLNLPSVVAWNVPLDLLDPASGERLEQREDSLPELCWLGQDSDTVEWHFNEAYACTPT